MQRMGYKERCKTEKYVSPGPQLTDVAYVNFQLESHCSQGIYTLDNPFGVL